MSWLLWHLFSQTTWLVPVLRTPHGSSSLTTSPSWSCVSYSASMFPWSWTHTHTHRKDNVTHTATWHIHSKFSNLQPQDSNWCCNSTVYRQEDYHESIMMRCITKRWTHNTIISLYIVSKIHIRTEIHSLAAKEEEVQPQPGEDQHDDGDGEAEDEPRAKVYYLRLWITTRKRKNTES